MGIESANEAAFRRLMTEGTNKGNLAVVDEVLDPNCTYWVPTSAEPIRSAEGVKQLIGGFRAAFPDLEVSVEEVVTRGAVVAARVMASGTQRGELLGHPATGRHACWHVAHWARFAEGRLVEDRVTFNVLGLFEQLGLSPVAA